ncbi:Glycosyl phosphatidyl inositol anchor synthesis, partial [Ascosphaera acerosa]
IRNRRGGADNDGANSNDADADAAADADAPTAREASVPRPLAPFLRSRVLHHGTFGVSHTRVPTESRPGHVALIAGLYEDVSAVTTGWKLNPVTFDSVFNRSRHTWSWGSPDILPMFKEGAAPGRVDADTYAEAAEDFTADATQLDTWVFERVKRLFADARANATLAAQLRQDKLVFFLHLLGLDTAGHAYRPYSPEYLHGIKVVDAGVREISALAEDFFGDGRTAFVFTADHGMSDWGSHGDGHPDNTRTPLVAWGAGVAPPRTVASVRDEPAPGHEDGFSADWRLDHVHRHDVEQADVAALMAWLVGLDFPANSVGALPLAYLDANPKEKALAALANARAVLEMYHVKEARKRAELHRARRFAPFPAFAAAPQHGGLPADTRVAEVELLINRGEYDAAVRRSQDLLRTTIAGLRYLQTYDWLFLRALVSAGYLGWIAYALTTVADTHLLQCSVPATRTAATSAAFAAVLAALCAVFAAQRASWRYYVYAAFPVFFWEEVVARRGSLRQAASVLRAQIRTAPGGLPAFLLQAVLYLGVLEALVASYFRREIYTACYLLGGVWPLATAGRAFVAAHKALLASWLAGCAAMSVFTLLPANKTEDLPLITAGGALMVLAGLVYLHCERRVSSTARAVLGAQLGLVVLAVVVTRSSVQSLRAKLGLPLGNQVVGWGVLAGSLAVPLLHRLLACGGTARQHYLHRTMVIFLAFAPTFVVLTISYEGVFYVVFCATVVTWVRLETALCRYGGDGGGHRHPGHRPLTLRDARVALFFFFLLQSAFFSTGNIASISSFSLDSVQRLIPVFNPFSQGALLLFKILVPFALISANLGILNRRLRVAPSALFMLVMAVSDVLTLNFFYMVKDEGSWLDIGTTISHFCIASGLCTFVAGLEFLSELFDAGVKEEGAPSGEENLTGETADETKSTAAATSTR